MDSIINNQKLLDYSQDLLPEIEAKQVEAALRDSVELRQRLQMLLKIALSGEHSVGDVWRSNQLSCPSRSDWGRYILNLGSPAELDYFTFHLNVINCTICRSNLADLQDLYIQEQDLDQKNHAANAQRESRRQKFFQSSRGYIPGKH